jgi:hypothetical protein
MCPKHTDDDFPLWLERLVGPAWQMLDWSNWFYSVLQCQLTLRLFSLCFYCRCHKQVCGATTNIMFYNVLHTQPRSHTSWLIGFICNISLTWGPSPGPRGPELRVLESAGPLEVPRVLVTLSVCALLGSAGALVVSTHVSILPLLNPGACREGVVYFYILYLDVLEIHFLDSPCSRISLPFVCFMFGRHTHTFCLRFNCLPLAPKYLRRAVQTLPFYVLNATTSQFPYTAEQSHFLTDLTCKHVTSLPMRVYSVKKDTLMLMTCTPERSVSNAFCPEILSKSH